MTDDSLGTIGKLLFENEHVRVWDNVIEPGEDSPLHRHDFDYLSIEIEGDRLAYNPVKDGDFAPNEYDVTPGFYQFRGGVTGTARNIGATRFRTIVVELLDDPR
jgi:beta-alanine degradation protein BauB